MSIILWCLALKTEKRLSYPVAKHHRLSSEEQRMYGYGSRKAICMGIKNARICRAVNRDSSDRKHPVVFSTAKLVLKIETAKLFQKRNHRNNQCGN